MDDFHHLRYHTASQNAIPVHQRQK